MYQESLPTILVDPLRNNRIKEKRKANDKIMKQKLNLMMTKKVREIRKERKRKAKLEKNPEQKIQKSEPIPVRSVDCVLKSRIKALDFLLLILKIRLVVKD